MNLPVVDDFYDLYERGLTQGAIGKFLSCKEKFRLEVTLGLSTRSWGYSSAISFGLIFHDMLALTIEKVCGYQPNFREVGVLVDVMEDLIDKREIEERNHILETSISRDRDLLMMETEYGLCKIMLQAYFRNWASDLADLNWLALEQEFGRKTDTYVPSELYPGKKIPLRGKMDGVYRSKDGKIWLFETKTKSRIDDEVIFDRLPFEIQVQLYLTAIESIYKETPCGVLYNLIRRPQLRQGKTETLRAFLSRVETDVEERPDWYFARRESPFLPEERARWKSEFSMMIREIENTFVTGSYYRNSNACGGSYGVCQFIPICSRGHDFQFAQRGSVFPELSSVDEPAKSGSELGLVV